MKRGLSEMFASLNDGGRGSLASREEVQVAGRRDRPPRAAGPSAAALLVVRRVRAYQRKNGVAAFGAQRLTMSTASRLR